MPPFGDKLKRERDLQGITLQQISVSTKIGTRMLQAIEDEQFNQLPGGIFNKGFVRAYARFLGLDEEEILAEYLKASGNDAPLIAADAVAHESQVAGPSTPSVARRDRNTLAGNSAARSTAAHADLDGERAEAALERQLPWGVFAALLLVFSLTLSLWNRFERGHSKADSGGSSPSTAAMQGKPPEEVVDPAQGKTLTTTAATFVRTSTVRTDSSTGFPINSNFSLQIQAREESWITITADGKQPVSQLMTAGSKRTIVGTKEIVVRAGNSGGIDFELNGKKLAAGGQEGEVKTITFGPRGII